MISLTRLSTILALAFTSAVATETDEDVLVLLGELPRPGNIEDVLLCMGTNQVYWRELKVTAKGSAEENEAQLKASWYSAVALWIFAVENQVIHDAIEAAGKLPESERIETALRCRQSPGDWQNRPAWREEK